MTSSLLFQEIILRSSLLEYLYRYRLIQLSYLVAMIFIYISTSTSSHAAEDSIALTPFKGSIPVSNFVYTSNFIQEHITAMEEDALRFALEQLIPSVESLSVAESSGFSWNLNSQDSIMNDSSTGLRWFYLDLTNNSEVELQILIEVKAFQGVGWIYRDATGSYQVVQALYESYIGGRIVFDRDFVLPIEIAANQTKRVFGYAYSISTPREGFVNLWDPESFREQRAKQHFVDGAYYGFLLALVFYSLTLYLALRQILYLYAGLFQLCVGGIVLFASGYSILFVFPNNLVYAIPAFGIVFILVGTFSGLFSISLLQIKKSNSLLYRIWMALIIWGFIQIPIVAYFTLPSGIESNANRFLLSLNALIFVFSQALHIYTLTFYWKRARVAKYWFAAVTLQVWLLVALQLAGTTGTNLAELLRYIVQVFTVINGVILIWLISHVIKNEQLQRELAQEEALNNLQIANDIQQSKTNFITTAGHDLRQPLEAIRLHLNALQQSASTETRNVLDKVGNNVKELSALLSSLMNLSKSTVQIDNSSSEDFLLNDVLDSLHEETEPFAKQKGLVLKIQSTPISVHTSKVGLTQIIRNIMNNSIKFTKDGEVKIEVEDLGTSVAIRVIDAGCGIPEQELNEIFTEFYQLDKQGPGVENGMGLGLSIVERLTKSLAIPIHVDSKVGVGTSFELHVRKSATPIAVSPPSRNPTSLSGIRIAILNPNSSNGSNLKLLMEQWGAMVSVFPDVESAEQYISIHSWLPDLIVATEKCYQQLAEDAEKLPEQECDSISRKLDPSLNSSKRFFSNFTSSAIPTVVLYQTTDNNETHNKSRIAKKISSNNRSHHWFEDPIDPGVLRSFIQRMVVSPAN